MQVTTASDVRKEETRQLSSRARTSGNVHSGWPLVRVMGDRSRRGRTSDRRRQASAQVSVLGRAEQRHSIKVEGTIFEDIKIGTEASGLRDVNMRRGTPKPKEPISQRIRHRTDAA
jgi:hypothetical protein